MMQHEWAVGIDESALGRLKLTEATFHAKKPSLLLSVKIEVVARCGDPLPSGLKPRDVWIKIHSDGRWLWRHVESNEMFWESNGMPSACDDGNATKCDEKRWKRFYDTADRIFWKGPEDRFFYESTGTMDPYR